MEDGFVIISKLQKLMRENLQKVGDVLVSGGVDNMENYKYIIGQINAYEATLQEILSLIHI